MSIDKKQKPWDFLAAYRGEYFEGEWPTVPEMFNITVKRYPNNRCFTSYSPTEESYTYEEVMELVLQVSNYLLTAGVTYKDKVAVTGKNSIEWAVAYLAVLYAGGIVVPLDYQLKPEEMNGLLKFAGVKILFADEEKYDLIDADGSVGLQEKIALAPGSKMYLFNKKVKKFQERNMPAADDLAAILFTSGTTGTPKGVMLTHSNLVSDCYLAQGNMNIYSTDVFYALLPIHHSYTMLAVFIEGISVGAEIVFGKKLVVKQILKELKDAKVTMFLGVPMLFNKLIKGLMTGIREKGIVVYGLIRFLMSISGLIKKVFKVNPGKKMFHGLLAKISLDTNRICICGGGPLPASTFKMFNQLGIDFVQGYGLTETSPIIALNPTEAYIETSVGKVTPQTTMKILEPDEKGIGEIAVKGPTVMRGYYNNPEATAEVLSEDGWLRTGDVGYLDENNYLYLTGRQKSLIVTEGGKNVFPEEIEDEFQLYDEIDQILIIGYLLDKKTKAEGIRALVYPDAAYVESVEKKTGKEQAVEAIQKRMEDIVAEVNKHLLPYKRITKVTVIDEPMEMTTTKKIKRFLVAKKYSD